MKSRVAIQRKNSKMGKVMHISLPPIISCAPGLPCNKGCYALKAWRMYPNSRSAWTCNLELWQADHVAYEAGIRGVLFKATNINLFRWHMAGDIQSYDYLKMMIRVAEQFTGTKFLAFTKRYDLIALLDRSLPTNLNIILSAWPGLELVNPHNLPVAWMDDGNDRRIPSDAVQCAGRCDTCEICWNLKHGNVKFHKH